MFFMLIWYMRNCFDAGVWGDIRIIEYFAWSTMFIFSMVFAMMDRIVWGIVDMYDNDVLDRSCAAERMEAWPGLIMWYDAWDCCVWDKSC